MTDLMKAEYLIRKGAYYYRPKAQGYTVNVAEAGRYTLDEAISHSHPNGPDGPRDGISYELAPPSPPPDYRDAEIARLTTALEKAEARAEKFMWQVRDTCARAEKAEAKNVIAEKMAGALEPFALEADKYDPDEEDGLEEAFASSFTMSHLRRARAVICQWKGLTDG